MNVTGPICVMLAVALAGCATTKKLHEPDLVSSIAAHKNLGVLAVAFSAEATDLQVEQAPVTKLKASWNEARDSGKMPAEVFLGRPGGGGAGTAIMMIGLTAVLTPVFAVAGGIFGAVSGVAVSDIAAVDTARKELQLHEGLASALGSKLRAGPASSAQQVDFLVPDDSVQKSSCPRSRDLRGGKAGPHYPSRAALQESGFDTVLSLRVERYCLRRAPNSSDNDPLLSLSILIRGQLIHTSDWTEAGTVFAKYESEQLRYSQWAKSNAKQLRAEWDRALESISQQIAEWFASSK